MRSITTKDEYVRLEKYLSKSTQDQDYVTALRRTVVSLQNYT